MWLLQWLYVCLRGVSVHSSVFQCNCHGYARHKTGINLLSAAEEITVFSKKSCHEEHGYIFIHYTGSYSDLLINISELFVHCLAMKWLIYFIKTVYCFFPFFSFSVIVNSLFISISFSNSCYNGDSSVLWNTFSGWGSKFILDQFLTV